MPWKIKSLDHNSEASRLHMYDAKADVHMVTHLKTGVVDIFIGADHPANARIWVSLDAERGDSMVKLERVHAPHYQFLTIILSVMSTMGLDPIPVSVAVQREIARHTARRKAAWPEYVTVVDEPHHGLEAAE